MDISLIPVSCVHQTGSSSGETSVSRYVAAAEKVLREYPNLRYRLDPMFTTIDGDLREIFEMHHPHARRRRGNGCGTDLVGDQGRRPAGQGCDDGRKGPVSHATPRVTADKAYPLG